MRDYQDCMVGDASNDQQSIQSWNKRFYKYQDLTLTPSMVTSHMVHTPFVITNLFNHNVNIINKNTGFVGSRFTVKVKNVWEVPPSGQAALYMGLIYPCRDLSVRYQHG